MPTRSLPSAESSPAGVIIRPEQPGDADAIGVVLAAAFNSQEHADLVAALRASPSFIPELSLVAEVDDQIVGHVMIGYVGLEDDGLRCDIASLSPLATRRRTRTSEQRDRIGAGEGRHCTRRRSR
ncbi:MAG: hypothetical protein EXQ79_00815 [Acidimicrobiia bacterium]|nr:hypothetical protein [Acidimicrobiia bacterium]